jgi:glutamate-1-semialdehyde 2,1-aminomutase
MYPDAHSKSARLYDRAIKSLPGGNSRTTVFRDPYPVYAAKGQGCKIWDADGVERLDMVNNQSSLVHGHCHPSIVAAIQEQAATLACAAMPTGLEIDLAEKICERIKSVERVSFCNSGSEAVLFGLRAARAYTGRDLIAKAEGAYHGNTSAMEVSVFPSPQRWGDENAPTSVPEGLGITQKTLQDTLVLPFNNVDASRHLIEEHASQLACVIIDPAPPRMGFLEASDAYLAMLREVTIKHGILLMFDEVYSFRQGFHGAQGRRGIEADLTSLGKLIGGGLPVGATAGTEEVMSVFDPRNGGAKVDHGGTFNANPITMAAGIAAMDLLTQASFDHLYKLGDHARSGLQSLFAERGVPVSISGSGSLFSLAIGTDTPIHNVRDATMTMITPSLNGKSPYELGKAFNTALLNRGVVFASPSLFILSTAMTIADIDMFLEKTGDALDEIL